MRCMWTLMSVVTVAALWGGDTAMAASSSPAMRRDALIRRAEKGDAAVPVLRGALADPNRVVRRTAARLLVGFGAGAQDALRAAFENDDAVVRQTALKGLIHLGDDVRLWALGQALKDASLVVRLLAVNHLAAERPVDDAEKALLELAVKDNEGAVSQVASKALWPFHRQVTPLRERKDWDHEVDVIQTVTLPKAEWAFKLDPDRDGHLKNWYEPDFDDSDWARIEIEQAWQKAGYEYTGVTWYRRVVNVPERPEGEFNAVDLAFGGVDESAWVWVNGTYVGDHDVGPSGWNQPFTLDITDAITWGEENQITVRAMNTAHAGGIWRPVRIEILR